MLDIFIPQDVQDKIVFYFIGGAGLVGSFLYWRNEEGVLIVNERCHQSSRILGYNIHRLA